MTLVSSILKGLTNFDGFSKKMDSLNLTDEISTVIIFVIDGPKLEYNNRFFQYKGFLKNYTCENCTFLNRYVLRCSFKKT